MATWEITGPNGEKYRVDGDSAEGAARAVQAIIGGPKEDVVASTADGGRVVRSSSGALSFTSPGYSTSDPDAIARIMEGATPRQEVQRGIDEQRIAQNPVAARAQEVVRGVPFVGEYADEAVGMVSPEASENMRATSDAMQRQRPGQTLGLNIAGGVAGGAPFAGPVAGVIGKAPGLAGKTAAAAGAGAVLGGAEGAVSGFGAGRTRRDRRRQAAERAGFGAAAGGLLGAVAPIFGEGARSIVRRVKRLDVALIADEFGTDRKTASVIRRALENDDLDEAARRIDAIGEDAMLADAGLGTAQALDTVTQTGGQALRIARTRVDERAAQAGQRLNAKLDDILGAPEGVKAGARSIAQRTAGVRQKAYDRAYSQPIDYSAAGRNIEGVLQKIPSGTLQRAVREANEEMQSQGLRNMQIMAQIADDGSVTFREMPNVQQLDFIKRALGDIANSETDAVTGRISGAGLRARRLAKELRDAVSDAVPDYSRAVRLGGDKIAEDEAFDIGRKLLSRSTSVEDVRGVMQGASEEAKLAAKRGMREQIEQTLSNVRATLTDRNTDAREAMQLVKELSSRANTQKARFVLGTDAKALFDELETAEAALTLRAAIAENSKTASRLAMREGIDQATAPGAIQTAARGQGIEAAQKVVQALTGATDEFSVEQRERIYAQIADVLTSKRGADAARALRLANKAMAGQPLKNDEAAILVKEVGAPTLFGIHQSATQYQGQ